MKRNPHTAGVVGVSMPGTSTAAQQATSTFERALAAVTLACCLGLIVYKVLLSTRLSVNWDEFFFLSHVYSLLRGDLNIVLLTSYTHLFTWLTRIDGDELQQIVVARWTMLVLLGLTCWLIFRLGNRWLSGFAATVPCFIYLSAVPVLLHGGSFRYDSMLAPLSVAILLLLTRRKHRVLHDYLAGILCGVAITLTLKAVLFAPLFLAAAALRDGCTHAAGRPQLWETSRTVMRIAIAAAVVSAVLLGLHSLSVVPGTTDTMVSRAGAAASKTLLETPWFPRIDFLWAYVRWQPLHWLLIALGTAAALIRRNFAVASLSLALLPIAFYRNAFPYYYVVMLAPAAILAGFAVQELMQLLRPRASRQVTSALLATIWVGLLYQGVAHAGRLLVDDQLVQRMLLTGIHRIFPEPTNYVDRCGMVPSFRKVNFFMSTWGMENYRKRGEAFMPAAIREHRPSFVLANVSALNPKSSGTRGLLPEDRELIAEYYPRYWGPVRVAGARAELKSSEPIKMRVPFPDRYRIRAVGPVAINGILHENGDVIDVPAAGVVVEAPPSTQQPAVRSVELFLAAAAPPPPEELPRWPLFTGL